MAKAPVDREAPTTRPTQRTNIVLAQIEQQIEKLGARPGKLYDVLRAELTKLAEEIQAWRALAPTPEQRVIATNKLMRLMRVVHSIDQRHDPERDPRVEREDEPR